MVSVIMPVFNTPINYLIDSVDSILNQTYKNFELIIVDESTEKDVINFISKQSDTDPRIKYHHFDKGYGYINCLNFAINVSKGKYLARSDSDDISLSERIEVQKEFLNNNNEIGIIGSCATIIDENGMDVALRTYPKSNYKIKKQLHIWNPICHSSIMIRSNIIKDLDGYSNKVEIEDYDLWFRAKENGVKFTNLEAPLIKYRIYKNKKAYNRGRHWKNNLKIKAKYFSIRSILYSLIGIIFIMIMIIIPSKVQQKIYYYFNLWR